MSVACATRAFPGNAFVATITAVTTIVTATPGVGHHVSRWPCSIFNSASARAALKLKYKPKIVDGKATSVDGVLHRFTFIMATDE